MKANLVVDALNRRSRDNMAYVSQLPKELHEDFAKLNLSIVANTMELVVELTLDREIHKDT